MSSAKHQDLSASATNRSAESRHSLANPVPRDPSASGKVRHVRLRTSGATIEYRQDGSWLVTPEEPLKQYPRVLTDRLAHWANVAPDRTCVAKRNPAANGEWRRLTYAQVFTAIRSIGQALLNRNLSADRPVMILSENDIDQYLLTLAGQHVGIPVAPLSPAYSLLSKDFSRLNHALNLVAPGLVFAADGERYRGALEVAARNAAEIEVVVTARPPSANATLFADLAATTPTPAIGAAHAQIDPASVAKILFTSGSTAMPKGVINTHRMICSNQQMIAQIFPFLEDEPPVFVDWLPWNHTFGGNHNLGIALYNGGTFYIDDGRPGPGMIDETIRNLREIPTTVHFNVPKGYEDLLPALRSDRELRETFFRRMSFLFYAGAGLSQLVWDAYRELAQETCGERIVMATGLGSTETGPMAIQTSWETDQAGVIGIPVPGVELKLVPRENKLEARVRGASITPGYWRQPELTQQAFDEEGFYSFGDALRFVDPNDVNKGFLFDGRFSEDFKLASGTWVSVGPLRTRILAHCAPFVRDVVIAGHDRDYVTMLIFPDRAACATLSAQIPKADASISELIEDATVRGKFQSLLAGVAAQATGSSNRVTRAILIDEPPSLDAGEVTDKGSLNQRAVLERRKHIVEELYAINPSPRILKLEEK